jgi:E3 ubiquitin-protein ligase Topors
MSMNVDPVAPKVENDDFVLELDAEVDEDHCSICLQAIVDRALIPECSHEFCFECLMIWTGKNPLSSPHIHSTVHSNILKNCSYYRTV